ncbi:MAG: hypothetical protein JWN93_2329 [Hyphomicrobiales bacterium]|jgi:hypothetical protein|nr:hypothetical protein [Hyphomicrobiales bacterium]
MHERNLVLVHQPGAQALEDFLRIGALVSARAPDIETLIASNDTASSVTRKKASRRPSLVFSPLYLRWFAPTRGKVYAGRLIPKDEQLRVMAQAGVRVPRSELLGTGWRRETFGELAVVKPTSIQSSKGVGVRLARTSDLEALIASGGAAPEEQTLVQQFIDTGEHPSYYRVFTCFGRPVLAYRNTALHKRPDLSRVDDLLASAITVRRATGQKKELVFEDDVLSLAARIHAAFPDVPWQACDIVREAATGELYALEINPGGNTWVFSRESTPEVIRELGGYDLQQQFNAFETIADELVRRTRAEAA